MAAKKITDAHRHNARTSFAIAGFTDFDTLPRIDQDDLCRAWAICVDHGMDFGAAASRVLAGRRARPVEAPKPYRVPGTFEKCDHPVAHPLNHYRCACTGCWCCHGKELDCTCDIDWGALYNHE